jgi:hypothetical protein
MIQHRTKRAIYVVLLCVALLASGFSIYNQFASDNNATRLADQVTQACAENRAWAEAQGLDCEQAKDVQTDGPAVIQGPKGERGERGFTGEQGDPGMPGRDGDDAPIVAGPQGTTGATGSTGQTGATGEPGKEGPEGPQGPPGQQGPQGERGADGQPGEPAPEITGFAFQGGPTDCELVITMSNETSYRLPAPGAFCVP